MAKETDNGAHGLTCPQCGYRIPVTIRQILSFSISCPCCDLTLTVDRQRSDQALDALRKVNSAHDKVRETSNFKR